ncbi:MAG: acyl-CoA dehydrogenase family protein [Deltaproteobacteria bacterium]|nr:acyl-CoA dehydrogenase family protein [Deltaproteobacteria bacterium]
MPTGASDPVQRARDLQPLVRAHADEAERERRLPRAVALALAEAGLYRLGAPKEFHGEDSDPMQQIAVIEAISTADGSAGWNLMIGIESFGLIAPAFTTCPELIADPRAIFCSSTAAVGRAERESGGYRVTGQWQFVSGCHNSSAFGGLVLPHENGAPKPGAIPVYAMVEAPHFEILDTWHVGGLRGSGSHDVRLSGVFVPDARIVSPIGATRGDSPFLRFPLGSRLAYNKVGVCLGIARAGIDAFVALAEGKVPRFSSATLRTRGAAHRAVALAEVRVRAARALVFELVAELWERVRMGAHVTTRERALFQIACSDAARGCAEAVDLVCDAAGTTANQLGHPLERIARDVRVVRQHTTVASHHIDDAGRALLGLEPEGLMLRGR